jgi:hypothetical protein
MTEVEGPLALKVVLHNKGDSKAEAQGHTFLTSDLEKSVQIHTPLFFFNPLKTS